ncbi:hypothetical protein THRCLA_20152 [Thraustotheca clavata]|uniref:Uncharacterized protein n=1 Tax=Thraustotheca clavata TaxID=74557 RepID=A0A1W0AB39_9STRA|nr:hypothetical protein THRCLA_20152 [Thraustotheca clavata]
MEIASDVRELLVGLKEPNTVAEQQVLLEIQDKHEAYCVLMHNFSAKVAELSLAMSPEARIFFYQLQRAIYQDWTSTITECAFFSSSHSPKTLECKLESYEQVVARCMGPDAKDVAKCSSQCAFSLDANDNPSIEQCVHMYEAHRQHFHQH